MTLPIEVTLEYQGDLSFDLGLQKTRSVDRLAIDDRHVVQQRAEVRPIYTQLLLHCRRGKADLATDELIAKKREAPRRRSNADGPPQRRPQRETDKGGVLGEYGLSEEQGNEIIMAARAHWFEDEVVAGPTEEAAHADSTQ